MTERQVEVLNFHGVHARPASMIVEAARRFKSEISLIKNGAVADAKSIMTVMMLAAVRGSIVTIRASGEDEEAAVEALTELFKRKFDEE